YRSVAHRDKAIELRDAATGTRARLQQVAIGTELPVIAAFDVEAGIIGARAAGPLERGAEDPAVAHEQQQPVLLGRRLDADDARERHASAKPLLAETGRRGTTGEVGHHLLTGCRRARRDAHDDSLLDPDLAGPWYLASPPQHLERLLGRRVEAVRHAGGLNRHGGLRSLAVSQTLARYCR